MRLNLHPVSLAVSLAIGLSCTCATAWAGNAPSAIPTDTTWADHFDGPPGGRPPQWLEDQTLTTALVYSSQSSYATVSRTALAPDNVAAVVTNPISCNVDEFNLIEIRVSSVSDAPAGWQLCLLENGRSYPLMNQATGASGTFTFPYARQLGWTGHKYFSLQLLFHGPPGKSMNVDYLCVFKDRLSENALWREDFDGPAGGQPGVWFDATNDAQHNAEIVYAETPSLARITLVASVPADGPWGKVLAPAIYCDVDRHHWLEIKVNTLEIGTRCKIQLQENGGEWKDILLGKTSANDDFGITAPGVYTFDFHETAGWNWAGMQFFSVVLILEGSAGKNVEVDYIKVLGPPVPTPTPVPSSPIQAGAVYAAPNPFLPGRNQRAAFFFEMEDPQSSFEVKIYNLKGQRVRTLTRELAWDGRNESGQWCEGGVYIFQVETGSRRFSGQVVLIQ